MSKKPIGLSEYHEILQEINRKNPPKGSIVAEAAARAKQQAEQQQATYFGKPLTPEQQEQIKSGQVPPAGPMPTGNPLLDDANRRHQS